MVRRSRAVLRRGGFLVASVALACGCGGSLASTPDGGGTDASASSSGSSGGIASSSGSTSSSGGSGSSSSGSSGSSSSGGSSSGGSCPLSCSSDTQCQQSCPPVAYGIYCCDQAGGACHPELGNTCVSADAGCASGEPFCTPYDGGANPNTGSPGCDSCIECWCDSNWCACANDSAADDAGSIGGCLGFVGCVIACLKGNPDGGVPPGTVQQCGQLCSLSHSMQQVQEGAALLSCMAQSCNTPATCGL